MKFIWIVCALALTGCSAMKGGPTSPTITPPITPPVEVFSYDINLPCSLCVQVENTTYPSGFPASPAEAQSTFNYSGAYGGAPNVYYGPIAPPDGMYAGVGIVVAPTAVSDEETFTHAEWPVCPSTCRWVGRFVYAQIGVAR